MDFSFKEKIPLRTQPEDSLFMLESNSTVYTWLVYNHHWAWKRPFFIACENPQVGAQYDFTYTVTQDFDTVNRSHKAFLLSNSLNVEEIQPYSIQKHQVTNVFAVPVYGNAIELDGKIWFVKGEFFHVGDEVEIMKESDKLIYLLKSLQCGDETKEILMNFHKQANGIYKEN